MISRSELAKHISLSTSTLFRLRRQGAWEEGVHFAIVRGRVLYNLDLIQDWIANQHQPEQHDRAIQQYLANLPSQSTNKKAGGRPAKKS